MIITSLDSKWKYERDFTIYTGMTRKGRLD